jgi:hypothetical protein
MRKASLVASLVMMWVLTSISCSSGQLLQGSGVATQPAQPGAILFMDDFSSPNSGWTTWSQNGSLIGYQGGGLRFFINQPHYDFWSRPGKQYNDARIEVDTLKLDGPDNNDFGIICRFRDRSNYYAFLISSDGYYGILKVKNGVYLMLNELTMKFDPSIKKGKLLNHLRADCVGQKLTFYANGKKLVEVTDGDFSDGEVGLVAGTYDQAGVDIFFRNFVVYNP